MPTFITSEGGTTKLTDETGAIFLVVETNVTDTSILRLPVDCVMAGNQPEPGKLDYNNNPMALKAIFRE